MTAQRLFLVVLVVLVLALCGAVAVGLLRPPATGAVRAPDWMEWLHVARAVEPDALAPAPADGRYALARGGTLELRVAAASGALAALPRELRLELEGTAAVEVELEPEGETLLPVRTTLDEADRAVALQVPEEGARVLVRVVRGCDAGGRCALRVGADTAP